MLAQLRAIFSGTQTPDKLTERREDWLAMDQYRRLFVNNDTLLNIGVIETPVITTVFEVTVPENARKIMMQATVKAVRYSDDETNPTATTKFRLLENDTMYLDVIPGSKLKFIQEEAGAILTYRFKG